MIYDSQIHGSRLHITCLTKEAVGAVADVGERVWIQQYVHQRHQWLGNHRRSDLRATVYRMEAFETLLAAGDWDVALPLVIRGLEINEASLSQAPPRVYDGPPVRSRTISLTNPLTRGFDVRRVQMGLSKPGNDLDVSADGVFGRMTRNAVESFQVAQALARTGVVDAPVFDSLGF